MQKSRNKEYRERVTIFRLLKAKKIQKDRNILELGS